MSEKDFVWINAVSAPCTETKRDHTPQGLLLTEISHNFYKAHKVLSLWRETVPTLSQYRMPVEHPQCLTHHHPCYLDLGGWRMSGELPMPEDYP